MLTELPIDLVYPNPDQPRKHFDQAKLEDLAASIKEAGLQQYPKVRPDGAGKFMLACGERRYRAHLLLGRTTIQVIVEAMDDNQLDDVAIIENMHRADITPIEEGRALARRLASGISPEDLAKRLGITTRRIHLRTSLLKLAPEYQELFSQGHLEPVQANQLARLSIPYQHLLIRAIRVGRCKTREQLRAVADRLLKAEEADGAGKPFKLGDIDRVEQASMFGDTGPTKAESAVLTAMEKKIEAVTDLVRGGFRDNDITIVRKISPRNAETMAARLELLERDLRKLRLELQKSAATASL